MFKNSQELKDFILWCLQQRIKSVQVGETKVEFSDYAFLDLVTGGQSLDGMAMPNEERNTSKTLVDTLQADTQEEEDLLYYSSKL